ncbi:MAG: hypothetical protein K9G62_01455 [Alphaproteobacteria bacterium]|nr:hypothetical protein [Alphaproteobacteria bacterium]
MLLLFGLTVPLIVGALGGHASALMIRDVIPFLFFLLPLFLTRLCGVEKRPDITLIAIQGAGLMFAVRAIWEVRQASLFLVPVELTYFANAPTILFTALFLMGTAALMSMAPLNRASFLHIVVLGCLSVVALTPLALTVQRAGLGYAVLYAAILMGMGLWCAPYRVLGVILTITILLFLTLGDPLLEIVSSLREKTALVGMNMRREELAAVWNEITGSPLGFLFGTGWGGTFESPAVGGVRVNYTHSLLSSILLKTGLIGLLLTGVYLWGLAREGGGMILHRPVLALALAGPVAIDVFLYASFKSLDFGLILLLITLFSVPRPGVALTSRV